MDKIGGFVTKGLSREPMPGNDAPRIIETASGMINAIGLQNIGSQPLYKKLPLLRRYKDTACIANVFGYAVDDYLAVVETLNDAEGVAAYELNASCLTPSMAALPSERTPRNWPNWWYAQSVWPRAR